MIRASLFLVLILLTLPKAHSQGEWNNWYFGEYAGMTFNSGSPTPIMTNPLFQSGMTVGTSVSDSNGTILFYSGGLDVWGRNNLVMPNGSGLLGGNGDAQSVIAVQNPVNKNQYYLFTVGAMPPIIGPITGLNYSVIDMQLNGGFGDIIPGMKNISLPRGDSAVVQLTSIRHSNNKDIWVVALTHGSKSSFLSYLINSTGINTIPVTSISTLNAAIRGTLSYSTYNTNIRISPDGHNLIVTDSITKLYYFNPTTGKVIPRFSFNPGSYGINCHGKEFSIDSRYLYVTITAGGLGLSSLLQYDMNSPDSLSFVQSETFIGNLAGKNLQMGPDWKIYLNNWDNTDTLSVIANPSNPGIGRICNYA